MTNKELLDKAGERIIKCVRDDAIQAYEQIESGLAKPPAYQALHGRIRELTDNHRVLVRDIVVQMVDLALHNVLWMLEGGEGLNLVLRTQDGDSVNLTEVSDGLAGELYSKEGWIAEFSDYPRSVSGAS